MATDTTVVIGIYITASGALCLGSTVYRILRAVDNAVVTLEAHTTAHAAAGFFLCLFFGQTLHALLEVAQNLLGIRYIFLTLQAGFELEVTQEQLVGRDDFLLGAVFVVVNGELGF